MNCLWNSRYLVANRIFANVLLLLLATTTLTSGQSITARLEIEAVNTREYGRVLAVRTIIKNETDRNIFLTNFLYSLEIERLNEQNQFENYFDDWFFELRYDSTRQAIEERAGITLASHDNCYDKAFFEELNLFNQNAKDLMDSTLLSKWCTAQVDRIQTVNAHRNLEFQTNVNSLPAGKYRFRYPYISANSGVHILPTEKVKMFKIPDTLFGFTRWMGSFDSGYLYLTIK